MAFYTLGCKLNFSETSTIARQFIDMGFVRVQPSEVADVYVVNSCSVTEHANKKCRQAIHKFLAQSPQSKIIVTGCYAQLKPAEIAGIKGVHLVLGADAKFNIAKLISDEIQPTEIIHCSNICDATTCYPAYSSGDRTRSFLKVQDGCDYRCSYCTIPLARGASRNIPISDVIAQANQIAAKGIKEIIITGVNTGDFGRTTGEKFIDLLRALEQVEGVERYRISSIEPNLVNEEVVGFVAESKKFLPHFHVPLQSGSNRILGLMRRRYQRELFAQRLTMIRSYMPHAFIGVDVIVGFPSETDADFMDSYNLLRDLKASFLHIFPYSIRPNTPAALMPDQVAAEVSHQRVVELGLLSDKLHREFYEAHVGTKQQVLFESTRKNGLMFGFTGNYIKTAAPYNKEFVGKIVELTLGEFCSDGYCKAIF